MIATGERADVAESSAMQQGITLGEQKFDDVFTGLVASESDRFVARIEDPLSQVAIQVEFGAPFRECVVYTPDHREAVCIEPYTCAPDPFRLQMAGVDAGLQLLAPGERLLADIEMQVRRL